MRLLPPYGRGLDLIPEQSLPHRADLAHPGLLSDDAGGRLPRPEVFARAVPCWVQDVSASERTEFVRSDLVFDTRVVFFRDPGLRNSDMVLHGGRTLRVKSSVADPSARRVWTVMAEEVT